MNSVISVKNLKRDFRLHVKEPGLFGSVKSLFKRNWKVHSALKGVSFDVAEGEIVGLVGANGAGKTTLVKILAGVIHPTSGDAKVLGHTPWERKNSFRRQFSMIMGQKAQLWWDLPAADSFLLLKEIYKIPPHQFHVMLDQLSKILQVEDLLNVQIRRLSLGERMKMELIAALLHSPKVIYLDEPTIGLDLTAQKAVRDFISNIQKTQRPATILTSHYMEDITELCERILILREGEIVYDGPLEKITDLYSASKHMSVTIRPGVHGRSFTANQEKIERLGEILEISSVKLLLKVKKSAVGQVASYLLDEFSVHDFNIEDEDIGTVIELIQSKGIGS